MTESNAVRSAAAAAGCIRSLLIRKETIMRAAAYSRVSTSDGSQSLDVQLVPLREFVAKRGWELVGEFVDEESGLREKRAGFESVMRLGRQRKVDVIIVASLDRWGRSLKQLVNSLDELVSLGVSFVSLRESLDFSTPTGQLMTHLLGCFAEFEIGLIRQRVKAGLANARARGKRLGRPPMNINAVELMKLKSEGLPLREISRRVGVSLGLVHKTLMKSTM
jgi:DNA invertase Pin-like site-specific DNA recombinase